MGLFVGYENNILPTSVAWYVNSHNEAPFSCYFHEEFLVVYCTLVLKA